MTLTTRQLGGKKAAAKNLAKDPDFYKKIGKLGGSVRGDDLKVPKGFARDREAARRAGKIGGITQGENRRIRLERS